MTADAATIRATVEAYCAAFTAGDQDAYVDLFADDAWIEDPVGTPRARRARGIGGFFAESSAHGRLDRAAPDRARCGWPRASAPSRCRPGPSSAAPPTSSTSST